MLSIFPELLDFSVIGALLLRGTAGIFFFMFGSRLIQVAWSVKGATPAMRAIGILYGALKFAVGVMLLLGVYTQVAALLGAVLCLLTILQDKPTQFSRSDKQVQILLLIICLSLLFIGPGYLSIDLPL